MAAATGGSKVENALDDVQTAVQHLEQRAREKDPQHVHVVGDNNFFIGNTITATGSASIKIDCKITQVLEIVLIVSKRGRTDAIRSALGVGRLVVLFSPFLFSFVAPFCCRVALSCWGLFCPPLVCFCRLAMPIASDGRCLF